MHFTQLMGVILETFGFCFAGPKGIGPKGIGNIYPYPIYIPILLLNNAQWSKIALRIQIRIQNCTQINIFSEK